MAYDDAVVMMKQLYRVPVEGQGEYYEREMRNEKV